MPLPVGKILNLKTHKDIPKQLKDDKTGLSKVPEHVSSEHKKKYPTQKTTHARSHFPHDERTERRPKGKLINS
jgi:hypothetical protein